MTKPEQILKIEKGGKNMEETELLKTKEGREKLAREFANLLDSDHSEPVPDRDAWVGEKKLRDFESAALPQRLYNEFAEFAKKAAEMSGEPTNKALFGLNQVNGLRRIPEDEREDVIIRELLEEIKTSVEALKDSPRKNRLLSLWSYHAGIFSRVIGDYLLAAESQDRSAELAEAAGDMNSEVISKFCATFERINHALVNDPESVTLKLAEERNVGKLFYETLAKENDPTSIRWKSLNGPLHLIFTHFWANEQYEGTEDYDRLIRLESIDPKLAKELKSSISVALAIHSRNNGNLKEAHELAEGVINGHFGKPPAPEYIATSHLLLGRIAVEEGNKKEAEQHLRDAIAVQGSAHQVRAVAKRELEILLAQ